MLPYIKNIIADIDGTLVDSNDAHAHAWVQAMDEHGYHVSFEKVRPLIGMGGDKVLPETVGVQKDSEQGKQIGKRRKAIFLSRYLPGLHAFPQAWELLQYLHRQGFRLVVASSSEPDELKGLLKVINPQALEIFEGETSAKDARHSKPDADVIYAALHRIDARPQESMMLGDTAYDIEAAGRADVKTIAFRCGGWSDHDLRGATAIYDGPADLLAHYRESPLAQRSGTAHGISSGKKGKS